MSAIVRSQYNKVFTGAIPAQIAVEQAAEQMQLILDEYWQSVKNDLSLPPAGPEHADELPSAARFPTGGYLAFLALIVNNAYIVIGSIFNAIRGGFQL